MKSRFFLLFSILVFLLSYHSFANADAKKINFGIGTYALTIAYTDPLYENDEFIGSTFLASYAFSNNIAIRTNLYSTEYDLNTSLEANGSDWVLLFGTGLENEGFKVYIGAGVYNETWEIEGFSENFSGTQFNAGIGYNWDVIVLDLFIGIRETTEYETFIQDALIITDAAAVSASFSLSARF